MSYITASTSVVLVATASATTSSIVFFPNISSVGRIITVRDNDGAASATKPILLSTLEPSQFVGIQNPIPITQPYGFVTLTSQPNGNYTVLNTFAFPPGQSVAYVSNVVASTITVQDTLNFRDLTDFTTNILYTSSAQLILNSTILGTLTAANLQSTVAGLGSAGYLSSLAVPIQTSRLIAVGQTSNTVVNNKNPDGTRIFTDNNTNWQIGAVNSVVGFSNGGTAVAFGNNLYVAAGNNDSGAPGGSPSLGYLQWSQDGSFWNNSLSPTLNNTQVRTQVAYGNGLWVAVGSNTGGGAATILYSGDGKNWSNSVTASMFQGGYATGVTYGRGVWVVSGAGGGLGSAASLMWSTNGSNWNTATAVSWGATTAWDVAFTGSNFVAVLDGPAPNIATSVDGKSWTTTGVTGAALNSAARYLGVGNGLVLVTGSAAAGPGQLLKYSLDGGFTWNSNTNFTTGTLYRPFFDSLTWWVGLNNGTPAQAIYYSFTGSNNWSNQTIFGGFSNGGYPVGFTATANYISPTFQLQSTLNGLQQVLLVSTIQTNTLSTGQLNVANINVPSFTTGNLTVNQAATVSSFRTNGISTTTVSMVLANLQDLYASTLTTSTIQGDTAYFTEITADAISTTQLSIDSLTANHMSTNTMDIGELNVSSLNLTFFSPTSLSTTTIETGFLHVLEQTASSITTGILNTEYLSAGIFEVNEASFSTVTTFFLDTDGLAVSSLQAINISTGSLSLGNADISSIQSSYISTTALFGSGLFTSSLAANTISTGNLLLGSLNVSSVFTNFLSTGQQTANQATVRRLTASTISTSRIEGITQLSLSNLSTNTLNANRISTGSLSLQVAGISTLSTSLVSSAVIATESLFFDTGVATELKVTTLNDVDELNGTTVNVVVVNTTNVFTDFIQTVDLQGETAELTSLTASNVSTILTEAATFSGQDIFAQMISTATIFADTVAAKTGLFLTVSTGTLELATAYVSSLSTSFFSTADIYAGQVYADAGEIDTLQALTITAVELDVDSITAQNALIEAISTSFISTNMIDAGLLTAQEGNFDKLSTATLTLQTAFISTLSTSLISSVDIYVDTLFAKTAFTSSLTGDSVSAIEGNFDQVSTGNLKLATAFVSTLSTSFISSAEIFVGELTAKMITSENLTATNGTVDNFTATTVEADTVNATTSVTSALFSGNAMEVNTISTYTIFAEYISAHTITVFGANTLNVQGTANIDTLDTDNIVAITITADDGTFNNLTGATFTADDGTITAFNFTEATGDVLTVQTLIVDSKYVSSMSSIYISTMDLYTGNLVADIGAITTLTTTSGTINDLTATNATITSLGANDIGALTVSSGVIFTDTISTGEIFVSTAAFVDIEDGNTFFLYVSSSHLQFTGEPILQSNLNLSNVTVTDTVIAGVKDLISRPKKSIRYSTDGSNWTNATSGTWDFYGTSIAYSPQQNLWVATGYDSNALNTIRYSGNGITWSNSTSGGFQVAADSNYYYGGAVAWSSTLSLWVAGGWAQNQVSSLQYSTDGRNWRASRSGGFYANPFFPEAKGVVATNTQFYAVGTSRAITGFPAGPGPVGTIQRSTDGSNWTNIASGGFDAGDNTLEGRGIAFNSSLSVYVAVGVGATAQQTIQRSTDGLNFVPATSGGFDATSLYGGNAVAYAGAPQNRWVAVGNATTALKTIQRSTDGRNWQQAISGGFEDDFGYYEAYDISYSASQNLWVAVGNAATSATTIQVSTDGARWTPAISGFGDSGEFPGIAGTGVAFGQGKWVAVGTQDDNQVINLGYSEMTSSNITTTELNAEYVSAGTVVVYGSNTLVVQGNSELNAVNVDGTLTLNPNSLAVLPNLHSSNVQTSTLSYLDQQTGAPIPSFVSSGKLFVNNNPVVQSNIVFSNIGIIGTLSTTNIYTQFISTGNAQTSTLNFIDIITNTQRTMYVSNNNLFLGNTAINGGGGGGPVSSNLALSNLTTIGFSTIFASVSQLTVSTINGQPYSPGGGGALSSNIAVSNVTTSSIFTRFASVSQLTVSTINGIPYNPAGSLSSNIAVSNVNTSTLQLRDIKNQANVFDIYVSDATLYFDTAPIGGPAPVSSNLALSNLTTSTLFTRYASATQMFVSSINGFEFTGSSVINSNLGISNLGVVDTISSAFIFTDFISAPEIITSTIKFIDLNTAADIIMYVSDAALYVNNVQVGGSLLGSNLVITTLEVTDTISAANIYVDYISAAQIMTSTFTVIENIYIEGGKQLPSFNSTFNSTILSTITYNSTGYLAAGLNYTTFDFVSSLFYSPNGTQWLTTYTPTTYSNSPGGLFTNATWNGTHWVATAIYGSGISNTMRSTLQTSTDGQNWQSATSGGFLSDSGGFFGNDVVYGNNLWVAVGGTSTIRASSIQFSTDRFNWSSALLGGFSTVGTAVAFGNNQFIAVGGDDIPRGNVQQSTDGKHWVSSLQYHLGNVNSIAYNGSYWLAGGTSGDSINSLSSIQKSTDGSNWAPITGFFANSNSSVKSIAWNGNYWLAGLEQDYGLSTIQKSTDGQNWIASLNRGPSTVTNLYWDSNTSRWFAAGGNYLNSNEFPSSIQTSTDGLNWTPSQLGLQSGSLFVSYGRVRTSNITLISTIYATFVSTIPGGISQGTYIDGGVVSTQDLFVERINGQPYNPGGGGGSVSSNLSLSNLFVVNAISTYNMTVYGSNTLTVNGNAYFNSNIVLTAPTSSYISTGISTFMSTIPGVAQSAWLAGLGTESSNLQYSTDGSNWILSPGSPTPFNKAGSLGWTGSQWFATGGSLGGAESTIQRSQSGTLWSPVLYNNKPIFQEFVINITSSPSLFVAVGRGGVSTDNRSSIQYSTDSSNWTAINSGGFSNPSLSEGFGVIYASTLWVAIGNCENNDIISSIQRSTDGSNWVASGYGFNPAGLPTVIAANTTGTQWIVGTGQGTPEQNIWHSTDATNWRSSIHADINAGITTIAWNGSYWLSGGNDLNLTDGSHSTIQKSLDGSNWTLANNGFAVTTNPPPYLSVSPRANNIQWNGSQWLAVGDTGYVLSYTDRILNSTDGMNWTQTVNNLISTPQRVAWGTVIPETLSTIISTFDILVTTGGDTLIQGGLISTVDIYVDRINGQPYNGGGGGSYILSSNLAVSNITTSTLRLRDIEDPTSSFSLYVSDAVLYFDTAPVQGGGAPLSSNLAVSNVTTSTLNLVEGINEYSLNVVGGELFFDGSAVGGGGGLTCNIAVNSVQTNTLKVNSLAEFNTIRLSSYSVTYSNSGYIYEPVEPGITTWPAFISTMFVSTILGSGADNDYLTISLLNQTQSNIYVSEGFSTMWGSVDFSLVQTEQGSVISSIQAVNTMTPSLYWLMHNEGGVFIDDGINNPYPYTDNLSSGAIYLAFGQPIITLASSNVQTTEITSSNIMTSSIIVSSINGIQFTGGGGGGLTCNISVSNVTTSSIRANYMSTNYLQASTALFTGNVSINTLTVYGPSTLNVIGQTNFFGGLNTRSTFIATYSGLPPFTSNFNSTALSTIVSTLTSTINYTTSSVLFMAVGNSGGNIASTIQLSTDGSNWTELQSTAPIPDAPRGIAFGNNLWVTVGTDVTTFSSTIAVSTDSSNWTPVTNFETSFKFAGSAVAYNGQVWVAGGSAPPPEETSSIKYSTDASNWTSANNAIFTDVTAIGWNGSYWLAGGQTANDTTSTLAVSTDGSNWVGCYSFSGGSQSMVAVRDIAWNGTRWVITGVTAPFNPAACIQYSSSSNNWTNFVGTPPANAALATAVAWNGSYFLATMNSSETNNLRKSTDGINWTDQNIPNFSILSLDWTGSFWIGTGLANPQTATSSITYSTDGSNWLFNNNNVFNNGQGIATGYPVNSISVVSTLNVSVVSTLNSTFSLVVPAPNGSTIIGGNQIITGQLFVSTINGAPYTGGSGGGGGGGGSGSVSSNLALSNVTTSSIFANYMSTNYFQASTALFTGNVSINTLTVYGPSTLNVVGQTNFFGGIASQSSNPFIVQTPFVAGGILSTLSTCISTVTSTITSTIVTTGNNMRFLIGGVYGNQYSTIQQSTDSSNFTGLPVTNAPLSGGQVSYLEYNGTNYVAIGNTITNEPVRYSSDLLTWNTGQVSVDSPPFAPGVNPRGLAYDSNSAPIERYFYLYQANGNQFQRIRTSTDGITWEQQANGVPFPDDGNGSGGASDMTSVRRMRILDLAEPKMFIVGENVATKININYYSLPPGSGTGFWAPAYDNFPSGGRMTEVFDIAFSPTLGSKGRYVIVGKANSPTTNIQWTDDSQNWVWETIALTSPNTGFANVWSVDWDGTKFIAVGNSVDAPGTDIQISYDGITWQVFQDLSPNSDPANQTSIVRSVSTIGFVGVTTLGDPLYSLYNNKSGTFTQLNSGGMNATMTILQTGSNFSNTTPSTVMSNFNSSFQSTIVYTGPGSGGTTTIYGGLIEVSTLSVSSINGLPYTGSGGGGGSYTLSSNLALSNVTTSSIFANYMSTNYFQASTALFTGNVSINTLSVFGLSTLNVTGAANITTLNAGTFSVATLFVSSLNGADYSGGGSGAPLGSNLSVSNVTTSSISTRYVSVTQMFVSSINGYEFTGSGGGGSISSNLAVSNVTTSTLTTNQVTLNAPGTTEPATIPLVAGTSPWPVYGDSITYPVGGFQIPVYGFRYSDDTLYQAINESQPVTIQYDGSGPPPEGVTLSTISWYEDSGSQPYTAFLLNNSNGFVRAFTYTPSYNVQISYQNYTTPGVTTTLTPTSLSTQALFISSINGSAYSPGGGGGSLSSNLAVSNVTTETVIAKNTITLSNTTSNTYYNPITIGTTPWFVSGDQLRIEYTPGFASLEYQVTGDPSNQTVALSASSPYTFTLPGNIDYIAISSNGGGYEYGWYLVNSGGVIQNGTPQSGYAYNYPGNESPEWSFYLSILTTNTIVNKTSLTTSNIQVSTINFSTTTTLTATSQINIRNPVPTTVYPYTSIVLDSTPWPAWNSYVIIQNTSIDSNFMFIIQGNGNSGLDSNGVIIPPNTTSTVQLTVLGSPSTEVLSLNYAPFSGSPSFYTLEAQNNKFHVTYSSGIDYQYLILSTSNPVTYQQATRITTSNVITSNLQVSSINSKSIPIMNYGTSTLNYNTTPLQISFNNSYNYTPVVSLTNYIGGDYSNITLVVSSITKTNFTVDGINPAGMSWTTQNFGWMSIGT